MGEAVIPTRYDDEGRPVAVGHTCPTIDHVQRLVRRSMVQPDRALALALLEELRTANADLRDLATRREG